MKSLQDIMINPANAILVIVDAQNAFCQPGGRMYSATSQRVVPAALNAIGKLAQAARGAGVPIIYIQSEHTPDEPLFTVFGQRPYLQAGSQEADIVDLLKPAAGDTVVKKSSHDPFYRTELDRVLQKLAPDPTHCYAIVTGGAANVCAYHAVLGFYLRNYWVILPVDAVYYSKENGKDLALDMLSWRAYPSVFLSRTDLIRVSNVPDASRPRLVPGS